ncbi:hypothetical protein ACJMK2_004401 [Sinanodonta woodiana]|uniref:MULE transposase domain-containing protein n=2 Tax=Sinanodonta woodiana TaxID=1069815 RepID=A0ABD3Y1P1_SINWO
MYSGFLLCSPDFLEECLECPTLGKPVSVFCMMALSNLLNLKVESVYPAINGSKDYCFIKLNCVFIPMFYDPKQPTITIMWTNTNTADKNGIIKKRTALWIPNHFVPLVSLTQTSECVELTSDSIEITASPKSTKSAVRTDADAECIRETILGSTTWLEDPAMEDIQIHPSQSTSKMEESHRDRRSQQIYDYELNDDCTYVPDLSTIQEESSPIQPRKKSHDINFEQIPSSQTDITAIDSEEDDELYLDDFVPGHLKKFMDLRSVMDVMKEQQVVLKEIPSGRKDGMYFIISNVDNIIKRSSGKRSEFWDDCGAWVKCASPSTTFIERNGTLLMIVKRQCVYCVERNVNKKRIYEPLQPQPLSNEIIQVHRIYQTLKSSPSGPDQFKRRITWFQKADNLLSDISTNIALAEYIGKFSVRTYHASVKHPLKNVTYIRTKPSVRQRLQHELEQKGVKEVERMVHSETNDDFQQPRGEKQLRNIKHLIARTKHSPSKSGNIADHIVCVEEMTKTSKFVQTVKHLNGLQHPVVTLYNEQQITDIKRFCCIESGSVLGMDKTYNLGDFHVTPTVFKDLSVKKRSTDDHPIVFGPTFIHTNSSTKAYSAFLHDVADNLTDKQLQLLTIGTDEELAFKTAIKRCLPGSTHVLCTRHLKQNANRHMEDIVGFPLNDRQEILDLMFSSNGLVQKTDVDTHQQRLNQLRAVIDDKDSTVCEKTFRSYFDTRLYPMLKEHVIDPVNEGKIKSTWTNNNSESANHILKSATKWKLAELPKFVKLLHQLVTSEQEERCRSLRNMGNYRLSERYLHHLVDFDYWGRMTEEQRDKKTKRFLTDCGKDHPNMMYSIDGRRTATRTPSAGRKPNQIRRKRAERSRTPSKTLSAKRKL